MRKIPTWLLLLVVAIPAAFLRFHDLGHAAVRSDEINFLGLYYQKATVAELWRNPPWQNQIPLAESISVLWHIFRPAPSEAAVREPFAVLGFLTVIGVAWWMTRRFGHWAGLLAGIWMAVLPLHVYQSREAYYYVLTMAFAAGLSLYSIDLIHLLRLGGRMTFRQYAIWTVWALLTCHTHMATWVVAGLIWLIVLIVGLRARDASAKRAHSMGMILAAGFTAAFMLRWVLRAVAEMRKVSEADGHLGGAFAWVGPRVIPFFTAGANGLGYTLTAALLVGAVFLMTRERKRPTDPLYQAMTWLLLAGLAGVYGYIGLVGGGAAKVVYFSTMLPLFLAWASLTAERIVSLMSNRAAIMVCRVALILGLAVPLGQASLMTARLDGKPVPYKLIRDWLDTNLEPGTVAVIDRWFEPQVEMRLYAPEKVTVTYTVPDEPYANYEKLNWRGVTQQFIESGQARAFIRLTRNHEDRAGLWRWPETYFKRHAVIRNEAGLWLRERGYTAVDDFNTANSNRVVTEIFYNTREDDLEQLKAQGIIGKIFTGPELRHVKTQDFRDWRVLEGSGGLQAYNLTANKTNVMIRLAALAPEGAKTVRVGGSQFRVEPGKFVQGDIGPFELGPGLNRIPILDPLWPASRTPLMIASIDIVPAKPVP